MGDSSHTEPAGRTESAERASMTDCVLCGDTVPVVETVQRSVHGRLCWLCVSELDALATDEDDDDEDGWGEDDDGEDWLDE